MSLAELRARLEAVGISPKRALGQNFLTSPRVRQLIAAKSLGLCREKGGRLLEIGPGLGALTDLCGDLAPHLIEFDPELATYWRSRGFEVTEIDALKLDWSVFDSEPAVLMSNLPYNIASPLLIERAAGPRSIYAMVLMFQKEVAERITASPSTKAYGLLSVIARLHFKVERLCDAAPTDFYPAPKVTSRVLVFSRLPLAWDRRRLNLVRGAFAFRRKLLLKNLKGVVAPEKTPAAVECLRTMGFGATVRAEELSPDHFATLFDGIYGKADQ